MCFAFSRGQSRLADNGETNPDVPVGAGAMVVVDQEEEEEVVVRKAARNPEDRPGMMLPLDRIADFQWLIATNQRSKLGVFFFYCKTKYVASPSPDAPIGAALEALRKEMLADHKYKLEAIQKKATKKFREFEKQLAIANKAK